jgi:signal transduction histidine kinase
MGLFVLASVLTVLAVVAWRRGRRSVARWFAAYTFATGGWVLGIAALEAGGPPEFWGRFTFASAALIPAGFVGFTRVYPNLTRWLAPSAVFAFGTLGIAISATALLTPWVVRDVAISSEGLQRTTGPLYAAFALYSLVAWGTSLTALVIQWLRSKGLARVQLQYLGTGLLFGAIGAVCTNLILPWITQSSRHSGYGPYFVLPYFVLTAHAVFRHRLLDIRMAIGRVAAFAAVTVGAGLAVANLVVMIVPETAVLPIGVSTRAVIVLAMIAVLCSAPVAPRIDALLSRYLFRGRLDYDRALSVATRRLTRALTPDAVAREFDAILTGTVVPDWNVILLPRGSDGFIRIDGSNDHSLSPQDARFARIARAYASTPGRAVRFLVSGAGEASPTSSEEQALRDLGAEVVILFGRQENQEVIGILGPKRDGAAYLSPTLNFIDELTLLATMAFDRAYAHARALALQREEERVAHLSRLSRIYAGLAHEIRTPLQTISSFVSMLPDYLDDPEYRTQVMRLVPAEVQRIISLAERLRALAPENPSRHTEISLGRLLSDIAALSRPAAEERGVRIARELPDDLPDILGDHDRLMQLFHNLVRNALEASESGTQVTVAASATTADVVVRVTDEGSGLDPAAQEALFEPFASTKGSGRGLGLSICLEIAQAHNASISLSNRPSGRGSIAEVKFARRTEAELAHRTEEAHATADQS